MLNNSTNTDKHLLLREKIRQQHLQNVLNTSTSIDNYYQSTSNNQLRHSQFNHHLQLFEKMQSKMTNVYNHLSTNSTNSFNSHLNPFTTNTFKQTLKQSSIIIETDDLNNDNDHFQLQTNQLNSSSITFNNQQQIDKDLTNHNTHNQIVNNLVTNSIGSSNNNSLINTAAANTAAAVVNMQSHHHHSTSIANTLIDSVNINTSTMNNSLNTNRFLVNQCSNNSASKLLLKPTVNGMSLAGLGNGHHTSNNILNNSNGSTMNMLGNMMISQQNNLNNSSTPSGLLTGGPLSAGSLSGSSSVSSALNGLGGGKKHHVDKHSDEYKRRRERNNIAVRKSREKAKQRSRETEKKVNELYTENDNLKQKLNLMSKEIRSLRQLLSKYGVQPEIIDRELESILKNDELQQQLLQHQQAQHQQLFNHHHQNQQTAQTAANSTVAHQHLQQTTNLFHSMHHPSAALTAHFSPHNHQTQHLSHY